jgi:ABC-type branched-subunit amino acid transport system permease subunit
MFICSRVVTGIGSALFVASIGSISPGTFDFSLSVSIFVGVVVGGRRGWPRRSSARSS